MLRLSSCKVLLICVLLCVSVAYGQNPHEACNQKAENAECHFMNREDKKMTGVCRNGACSTGSGTQQGPTGTGPGQGAAAGGPQSRTGPPPGTGTQPGQSRGRPTTGAGGENWMASSGGKAEACTKPPCAAPTLGDVAFTTASGKDPGSGEQFSPGENIYGPFEAGFSTQQNGILEGLGCANGNDGHVAGG